MKSSRSPSFTYLSFIILVVAGAVLYFYVLYPRPCTKPILYRIGEVDSRFGVNREQFLSAVEEGSEIWEKAIGKELFVMSAKGGLEVNLIYDKRQKETQVQQIIEKQIDTSESAYKEKRASLDALQEEYGVAVADYEASLLDFKEATAAYQSDVLYWNRRGGAPKNEYELLSQKKNELLVLQQNLESQRLALNSLAQKVNTLVAEVNALARETNAKVQEYNSSDLVGVAFDQGLYIRDASGTSINIYQFTDRQKLVRVLAHEFGHALGLEHNQNLESIMYEFNQGDTETISPDDLTALKELCKDALAP